MNPVIERAQIDTPSKWSCLQEPIKLMQDSVKSMYVFLDNGMQRMLRYLQNDGFYSSKTPVNR